MSTESRFAACTTLLTLTLGAVAIMQTVRVDTQRTRADSLQAELAECRAGNPCVPDIEIDGKGEITGVSLWIDGEYQTFYIDTTGTGGPR